MSALLPDKRTNNACRENDVLGDDTSDWSLRSDADDKAQCSCKNHPRGTVAWRLVLAFVVAVVADTLCAPLGEGWVVVFDLGVALILIAILGFNWIFIPALLIEAVPGLGLFPTWVLSVLALAGIKVMRHK
jgi:hypothetical protein